MHSGKPLQEFPSTQWPHTLEPKPAPSPPDLGELPEKLQVRPVYDVTGAVTFSYSKATPSSSNPLSPLNATPDDDARYSGLRNLPTPRQSFQASAQPQFRQRLDKIDSRILAKLDQPFGKENLRQCFKSEATLCNVLLPLWKSGFLFGDATTWSSFRTAFHPVQTLFDLLDDYGDVPFTSLRGFQPDWKSSVDFDEQRVGMVTAALLHFNGSAADMVRWIGGPHVAAHRDHATILH